LDAACFLAAESAKADFAIFQRRIHSLQRADGTLPGWIRNEHIRCFAATSTRSPPARPQPGPIRIVVNSLHTNAVHLDAHAPQPHPFIVPHRSRMFRIDPSDPTPVEAQIVRTVRSAVAAGLMSPGEPMPTVRQLAVDLRVAASAVARAYAELEQQRVLETVGGVGIVVRTSPEAIRREERFGELSALEDAFLRQASELGFSLDDVIIHLDSRRRP
jgi:GntR family transcriptional regulator